jgi:hypothetical protein
MSLKKGRSGLIKKGIGALQGKLREIRSRRNPSGKLSSMDRAAESYKRNEFLASSPRYSNGRPIPQLEGPGNLKGKLTRDLKKFTDKNPITPPSPITQKVQLPSQNVFGRKPVE